MSKTMPPLWLDYLRVPPRRQLPGILLLAGSLLLAGCLLTISYDLSTATEFAEQHFDKLRQASERRRLFALPGTSTAALQTSSISPSAMRWESLLASLEAAADDTVTLLSLRPGSREIVITGEAAGLDPALEYARRLQATAAFSRAHLAKYELLADHPRRPVLFTVLAEWREAGQ